MAGPVVRAQGTPCVSCWQPRHHKYKWRVKRLLCHQEGEIMSSYPICFTWFIHWWENWHLSGCEAIKTSNSSLANGWRNHSSVKRLGVVLSEVKMCSKVWFGRLMHLFALSLSTLSMPGGDKIPYSSILYTWEHFWWSNPYLLSKRGVCFWVSRNILKIWVLWCANRISLCFVTVLCAWELEKVGRMDRVEIFSFLNN